MRHTFIGMVLAAAMLSGACSGSAVAPSSYVAPVVDNSSSDQSIAALTANGGSHWTGSETATVGESGSLVVDFTNKNGNGPFDPNGNAQIIATITWVRNGVGTTVTGTATGRLDDLTINATVGSVCNYTATGSFNKKSGQITGTYDGTGPSAKCASKAGSFVLNKQGD